MGCELVRSPRDRAEWARHPSIRGIAPALRGGAMAVRVAAWTLPAVFACCALGVVPARLLAADPPSRALPGNPVRSVFFISKSENRNQVHYGVRVDEHCRPAGQHPMYGYWRDFEDGPTATSALLSHEQSAYGLTEPRWVRPAQEGGQIRIGLRGFPDRPLTIETFRGREGCRARAYTTIARAPAMLRSIYVEIGFLFSIDYVLVRGFHTVDGRPVQEKVND
jgi:hypothetical protein